MLLRVGGAVIRGIGSQELAPLPKLYLEFKSRATARSRNRLTEKRLRRRCRRTDEHGRSRNAALGCSLSGEK